ncbi:hypothetical protein PoB_007623700 [Plakobranchus ocellatus]|uniref:Uncharacterized protein n=1 Tax=Plakobranchus ocellatus TaxID=259542 RepID=A0AAV4E0B7_9GAST|nr:hypothetical protein PoB_007623700 [Plakobranchus ocellatus]
MPYAKNNQDPTHGSAMLGKSVGPTLLYFFMLCILQLQVNSLSAGFLYIASPHQGDLRLSGRPSGQGASGGARTRDRRIPADLRVDSLPTVRPSPASAG